MYKFGRTTRGTEGIHGIFAAVYHHQGVEYDPYDDPYPAYVVSYEQQILMSDRFGEPFAQVGDAGSLVFAADAEFVGLVTGGNTANGATYYTRRETLFKDIMRITGAKEIRLPLESYVGDRGAS